METGLNIDIYLFILKENYKHKKFYKEREIDIVQMEEKEKKTEKKKIHYKEKKAHYIGIQRRTPKCLKSG